MRGRAALADGHDNGFAARSATVRPLGTSVRMTGRRAAPEGRASATHGVRLGGSAGGPPERREPRRGPAGHDPAGARRASVVRTPSAGSHRGSGGPPAAVVMVQPSARTGRARRRIGPDVVGRRPAPRAGRTDAMRVRRALRAAGDTRSADEARAFRSPSGVCASGASRARKASHPTRGRTAAVRPARGPTNVGSGRTPRNPRALLLARS